MGLNTVSETIARIILYMVYQKISVHNAKMVAATYACPCQARKRVLISVGFLRNN